MLIRIVGSGIYGCHLALALLHDGHDVHVFESASHIFAGASGGIPARLHLGAPHYPRSALTRAACIEHRADFMERYGFLTRAIPVNLYAVAARDSLVDFGTYKAILGQSCEFLTVYDPAEFGLRNVEGAVQVGERHIVVRKARQYFEAELAGRIHLNAPVGWLDDAEWDLTIDATFCANDSAGVDRYEPCVTALLEGPTDKSVTITDGPFPSLYVWDEDQGLCSLTSARLTPLSKRVSSYGHAKAMLDAETRQSLSERGEMMLLQMEAYYPAVRSLFRIADYRRAIRAMPRSASDARLVDVVRIGDRVLRVRAGKIDAILHAERLIKEHMG